MLKNYVKIAFRNLIKNKIDSIISIGGMAVGIACCLLLVAFVQFEWSFDEFHKNSDRIFMVYDHYHNPSNDEVSRSPVTPYPLAPVLKANIPEMEKVIRYRGGAADVKINGKFVTERQVKLAEPDFLEMFSFPLISGNPKTALTNPNSIILTREKAKQIFGTEQAMGETLMLRNEGKKQPFTVTGIMDDIPDNSSIVFEYLMPFENSLMPFDKRMRDNWFVAGSQTYIMLNENANPARVEENLDRNLGDAVPQNYLNTAKEQKLHMLPLEEVYLSPELSYYSNKSSNPLYGWILTCIAFVVLCIAAINFMSLTLSRATQRNNEISIRKVIGASRSELGRQFLGEALLTCLLAFLLGGMLAELAVPWFSELINKPVSLSLLINSIVWGIIAGFLLLATLITGGYPAWVMSRKKASTAFNSRTTSGKIPGIVKGLIVFQFTLAITFVASAFIMYSQMQFIGTKDLGFNDENLVDIEMSLTDPREGGELYDVYSQEALRLPGVKSVTAIQSPVGQNSMGTSLVTDSIRTGINVEIIDEHFLNTMRINLISGRDFSADRPSELQQGVLLNQKAVELFGWENPVGKKIHQTKYKTFLDGKEVIGVVDDYHYRPLYHKVKPMIFVHRFTQDSTAFFMRARLIPGMETKTLSRLEKLWNEMNPAEVFNYSFVSDLVAEQYANQQRWKQITELASAIAILLACFGLFGLAALAAQKRIKEIGIRKVFGATISSIVGLLSKDFIKLVALGFVIAVPIAWYAMNQWLADFAYKIEIGPGIFALAGGTALFIALATVSWQSVRAALANPVESLRNE